MIIVGLPLVVASDAVVKSEPEPCVGAAALLATVASLENTCL